MWQTGASASAGLEKLAEGGDNTDLLTEAADPQNVTMSGSGVIGPGASETLIVEAESSTELKLSFVSMLVNTNDAFTGLRGEMIGGLTSGETKNLNIIAYDAGTEANSESASSIPGPAAGGEGFNAARDDRDSVGGHPGVVSSDDGLSGSALSEVHRFDNPVANVVITRMQ
ncbi:MAG: spondin domain-containing protein [Candidatus Thiodiazotropha taylori]|nr:spondin domain-containing protein [Candidatus Thiodiazotropha taylori]